MLRNHAKNLQQRVQNSAAVVRIVPIKPVTAAPAVGVAKRTVSGATTVGNGGAGAAGGNSAVNVTGFSGAVLPPEQPKVTL